MVHVKKYVRVVKGKSQNVTEYDNKVKREAAVISLKRPPMVGVPGVYPGERQWPGIYADTTYKPEELPALPGQAEVDAATEQATKAGFKVTPPHPPEVQGALDTLAAAGHDAKPLAGKEKELNDQHQASKEKATGSFVHPKTLHTDTPTVVAVPPGGHVSQHKSNKDSYLVHDARGKAVAAVGPSGKTKPPVGKARKSFTKIDHTLPEHGGPTPPEPDQEKAAHQQTKDRLNVATKALKAAVTGKPEMLAAARAGGLSVNPSTGSEPTSGFMVSQPDQSVVLPATTLQGQKAFGDALVDFVNAKSDLFANDPSLYVGAWVDHGQLYLDPSENVPDRAEAIRSGTERNQVAIFDVAHGDVINTGGNNGSGEAHPSTTDQQAAQAGVPKAGQATGADDRAGAASVRGAASEAPTGAGTPKLTAALKASISPAEHKHIQAAAQKTLAKMAKEKAAKSAKVQKEMTGSDPSLRVDPGTQIGKVSKPEFTALAYYGGPAAEGFNERLRNAAGSTLLDADQAHAALIDGLIAKTSTTKARKLYRGTKYADPMFKVGMTFVDHAFVSTSRSKLIAKQFADSEGTDGAQNPPGFLVEITLPKGSHGLDMISTLQQGGGTPSGEHEVLLPREQKFQVTGDVTTKGVRTVRMKAVPSTQPLGRKQVQNGRPQERKPRNERAKGQGKAAGQGKVRTRSVGSLHVEAGGHRNSRARKVAAGQSGKTARKAEQGTALSHLIALTFDPKEKRDPHTGEWVKTIGDWAKSGVKPVKVDDLATTPEVWIAAQTVYSKGRLGGPYSRDDDGDWVKHEPYSIAYAPDVEDWARSGLVFDGPPPKAVPTAGLELSKSSYPVDKPKGITPEQTVALRVYDSGFYHMINHTLRHPDEPLGFGDESGDDARLTVADVMPTIDSLFRTSKTNRDTMLFRGMDQASALLGPTPAKPGTVVVDHGLVSTSTNPEVGELWSSSDQAMFVLHVPKGAPAVDTIGVTGVDHKVDEVLLPRGTRMKILSDQPLVLDTTDTNYDELGPTKGLKGIRVVHAEVLPGNDIPGGQSSASSAALKALTPDPGMMVDASRVDTDVNMLEGYAGAYADEESDQLNGALRDGTGPHGDFGPAIRSLDNLLAKTKTTREAVLYKKLVDYSATPEPVIPHHFDTGSVINTPAYIRALPNPPEEQGNHTALFKIKLPKGSQALSVDTTVQNIPLGEGTVLLPRGMYLKVQSDTWHNGKRVVEVVPTKRWEAPPGVDRSSEEGHKLRDANQAVPVSLTNAINKLVALTFNPNEKRDPHTGEWTGGSAYPHSASRHGLNDKSMAPHATSPELDALDDYASVGYLRMNTLLRNGMTPEDSHTEVGLNASMLAEAGRIDSLLDVAQTSKPHTVYRGFGGDFLPDVADQFGDEGFISTTTDPIQADNFGNWKLTIDIPKGYSALDVDKILHHGAQDENEVLLRRGTHFKVVAKDAGKRTVHLRVVE